MSDVATGLRIERRFTAEGQDAYESIEWSHRDSRISNPDGSIVFEMTRCRDSGRLVAGGRRHHGVEVLPQGGRSPGRRCRQSILDADGNPVLGAERSAKQVFNRLAGTWRHWGEKHGYFASSDDAAAFEDELKYMLATQMAAPNSPQWFNTGLHHAYGLTGPAQGFWYVDPETEDWSTPPTPTPVPPPTPASSSASRTTW
jgi:ribonucleoside-diphosphate reductase alpha chain